MKRAFMSMVTAILLIGAVFINNASAASSEDNFDLNNITNYEKVEKLTTEYADAYITGKDQITYIVDSKKIHYKDENGSWRDIDNEIIQQKDISNKYSFKNKANDFLTSFGVNEGQPIAKIEKGKYSIEFVLLSDKSAVLSQDQSVEDQNNEYLKQINDQNNSLIYKNVFPNADMAYSVDGEELKEDIILYSKPSFTELVYTINVNNLGFRKETHEYAGYNEDTKEEKKYQKEVGVFYDLKTNDQIFKLDNFYMYDSNGKASYDLEWGYTEIDGEYILKILLDEKFLNDPEIKYPVVIDPTVQGPSVTYDTYASRKYPDNNYYLNTYIRTGKDADYGIRRTFIKWDLPSIATKYPITTAEIQLRKYSSAGATNLNAVRLTTSWSSSSVTWWNSPDSTTTHATMSGSWSGDWYKLDVTKFTRRWHCGRYSNYGVKIYDDNESSENVWTTFCSSDYSTASYTPKLIVNIYTGTSLWTRYTGGYYSRSIPIRNDLSSTYYSTQFSPAISAWTNSEANCTVYSSSSTDNRVAEVSSSESYYGLYIPYDNGGNPTQRFSIWLNYRTIEADKEWDGFARDVLIHELGHALWLNDREGDSYCIMGYSRDRNTLMHPAASDIAGVNSKWP